MIARISPRSDWGVSRVSILSLSTFFLPSAHISYPVTFFAASMPPASAGIWSCRSATCTITYWFQFDLVRLEDLAAQRSAPIINVVCPRQIFCYFRLRYIHCSREIFVSKQCENGNHFLWSSSDKIFCYLRVICISRENFVSKQRENGIIFVVFILWFWTYSRKGYTSGTYVRLLLMQQV